MHFMNKTWVTTFNGRKLEKKATVSDPIMPPTQTAEYQVIKGPAWSV